MKKFTQNRNCYFTRDRCRYDTQLLDGETSKGKAGKQQ